MRLSSDRPVVVAEATGLTIENSVLCAVTSRSSSRSPMPERGCFALCSWPTAPPPTTPSPFALCSSSTRLPPYRLTDSPPLLPPTDRFHLRRLLSLPLPGGRRLPPSNSDPSVRRSLR